MFRFYILIFLFPFLSNAGINLDNYGCKSFPTNLTAGNDNVTTFVAKLKSYSYIDQKDSRSLNVVCNEAKEETNNCCINQGKCSKRIRDNVKDSLAQVGLPLLETYYQVRGSVSGDPYEACKYSNLSQIPRSLTDAFKTIQTSSCSDSMDKCTKTCEAHYREFLITLIEDFIQNLPEEKATALLDSSLVDLREIATNVIDKCKKIEGNEDKIEKIVEEIDKKYKEGTLKNRSTTFTRGRGIEDFVVCDKILNGIEPKQLEASMRNLQLQACQQAAAGYTPPNQPSSPSLPSAPSGNALLAGNTPDTPDDSKFGSNPPFNDIGDDFSNDGNSDSKYKNNGFSSLAGGEETPSGGAPPGGGGGGGPPGGGPDFGDNDGDYGGYSEPEYWSNGGFTGSSGGGGFRDSDSDDSYGGDDDSTRTVASNTKEPLNLNKYLNHNLGKEKSIFQIASYRIQKYCSEKIKSKCL